MDRSHAWALFAAAILPDVLKGMVSLYKDLPKSESRTTIELAAKCSGIMADAMVAEWEERKSRS